MHKLTKVIDREVMERPNRLFAGLAITLGALAFSPANPIAVPMVFMALVCLAMIQPHHR